jgi:hypothetical protein
MAKVETLDFRSFIRNDGVKKTPIKFVKLSGTLIAVMIPKTAVAASTAATFGNVWSAVMNIVDWIVVGVFIFSGVSWMFGHRGKALELLIGGAAGYILARHAIDIRDFLRGL